MRFALVCSALVAAVAAAPQNGASGGVDLKPFQANTFKTIPFDDDKAKKGQAAAAAGNLTFSHASQNAFAVGVCPRRIEWRRGSDSDRRAFVNAIRCLYSRPSSGRFPGSGNRYEDLVSVHQQLTPNIHMRPTFLPYHRYFVAVFESLIRDECSYRGPMFWWDETLDAGNFRNSLIFRNEYFSPAPQRTGNGQGTCITTGTFANIQLNLGPGSGRQRHCLSRAVDESLTAQCNQNFVNYCNSFNNFNDMAACNEQGPHAYGHNGIGSVMSDVYSSPGDPVFFMHHLFVDRMWYRWQNANPGARMYQIPISLDTVLSSLGLRGDVRVRDMMDSRGGFLCYEYDY